MKKRQFKKIIKNKFLRAHLAGLVEGDGTIWVPKQSLYYRRVGITNKWKKQKYYPQIKICFPKDDYPLANKYKKAFGASIYWSKKKTYLILRFHRLFNVYRVARLINGYQRTPKIQKFESQVCFGNKYLGYKIKAKPVDQSDLGQNAWLTGFSEADGNFSININVRNKNTGNLRVQTFFRLELSNKINFKLCEFDDNVYETKEFINKIFLFFERSFYERERKIKGKTYKSLLVIRHNKQSVQKVLDYFTKYPFKGSKYQNFKDWRTVVEITKPLNNEQKQVCISICENFNSTRTIFSWEHLDHWNLYESLYLNKTSCRILVQTSK